MSKTIKTIIDEINDTLKEKLETLSLTGASSAMMEEGDVKALLEGVGFCTAFFITSRHIFVSDDIIEIKGRRKQVGLYGVQKVYVYSNLEVTATDEVLNGTVEDYKDDLKGLSLQKSIQRNNVIQQRLVQVKQFEQDFLGTLDTLGVTELEFKKLLDKHAKCSLDFKRKLGK